MSGCCKNYKNPCMVCKRTVTTKTGLQCQGSCKSWIHFTCCSYTPGKIKDIKAKVIKVRCPCPDCSTQGPKEVLLKKESSFTCINKTCPVNNPPNCTKHACPIKKLCQQTSTCAPDPPPCPPKSPKWPEMPCGASCKKNAQDEGDRCPPPPCPPPPCPPSPCPPPVCGMSPCPPPVCGMSPCPPPVCGMSPCPPPVCGMSPSPPPPCPPPSRPPSPPASPVVPSISLVENMCETVNVLSDQLNQLMCKMTEVLAPKGQVTPCRCPQNPRR